MITAYVAAMRRYAGFDGRASRGEFWWYTLAMGLIVFAALVIDVAFISGPNSRAHPFAGVVVVAHLLPALAVTVRRLHDTEHSGWLALINIVPLGGLVLLYFACQPGTHGPNRFGPDPLGNRVAAEARSSVDRAYAASQANSAPVTPQRDVIAEIERLAQLRAGGSLSDVEFEAMKAEALRRSVPA